MTMNTAIIVIVLLVTVVVLGILGRSLSIKSDKHILLENFKCNTGSCGSNDIDPVSDPSYNMIEIVKQSLLLEEHLAIPQKRCIDCQTKHLLMIIALQQEAICLAGDKVERYPYMKESGPFYTKIYNKWRMCDQDERTLLEIASALRQWRKLLMASYVFGATSSS